MDQQNQNYNNVIPAGTAANATSIAIPAADFRIMNFTIVTNSAASFTINVLKSNQLTPPDPTIAASATNQYSTVAYKDEGTTTVYKVGSLYNPTTTAVDETFEVETGGARWFFIQITGYVAGALLKCDATLFAKTA